MAARIDKIVISELAATDLLTNKRIDSRDTITVSLQRMQVDPAIQNTKFDFKKHRKPQRKS